MSDLLEEVDDIMRQERMVALWNQHGNTFIGIIAAIIIGTALVSGYKSWNQSVKESGTATLIQLVESTDFPANINEADLKMRPGLKGIALLSAAGSLVSENKTEEALTLFKQAANDKSLPDDLKDLAVLSTIRLQAGSENAEDAEKQLKTVWNNKKSPWRYQAHLEAAVIKAAKEDFTSAREHLNTILDAPALPETLYKKARALEKVYALKHYEQSKKKEASKS